MRAYRDDWRRLLELRRAVVLVACVRRVCVVVFFAEL